MGGSTGVIIAAVSSSSSLESKRLVLHFPLVPEILCIQAVLVFVPVGVLSFQLVERRTVLGCFYRGGCLAQSTIVDQEDQKILPK